MSKVITGVEFDQEVLKSEKPVVVDFFATWCGPCKMIAPAVSELENDMKDKAKVLKLDIDQAEEVCMKYGVRSVPTLLYFKNGEEVARIVGAVPKNIMMDKLNSIL